MKKAIIWLVLIVIGLGAYIYYLHTKNTDIKPNPIELAAKKNIQTEAKQIAKEVDKNGLQHTIYKMVKEIDQGAVDKVSADLLDTIDALHIAMDKVRQITVINTSLSIKNQALEHRVSDMATVYTHKDNYFDLSVSVPKDSSIAATFNAGYDADLITSQYDKKSWFLGSKSSYIDIYSNDLRFTIKGARTLTVKQKVPLFGFQILGKAGYNQLYGSSTGTGAALSIGRFLLSGDYKYYIQQNRWYWSGEAGYRLFGF
ncbi:MAG: hypothetical protein ABIN91_05485 [Mucilaginibacter sp.]|uniref:hypothetical protein n=1 Tax=Mucilaginibacter sp. TaxID=1882438 RepID=UPI0032630176